MDIAEIREKAKQLKDSGEEPALRNEEALSIKEVEIQPEPVPQVELPEDNEAQPSTDDAPEVEVRSNKTFFDLEEENRAGSRSWNLGNRNSFMRRRKILRLWFLIL